MTSGEIGRRIAGRMGIEHLNAMQNSMAEMPLPARALLLAPTGSGKTLAFAIPLLASLSRPGCCVQAAVIVPTRELATQVFEVLRVLAAPEYKCAVLYGGHAVRLEQASLQGNPDIVVGTPGRMLDHMQRGHLNLQRVSTLVLDEYDKSLDAGFYEQMKALTSGMRKVSTLILTSATESVQLPDFIDPLGMTVCDFRNAAAEGYDAEGSVACGNPAIMRIASPAADKLDTLAALLARRCGEKAIVFVNHRDAAERVAAGLCRAGMPVALYHGALDQSERRNALVLFANGTAPVLVATDLAARGLDIAGVGAVVHYHMPPTAENWKHRNGRTARQGAPGEVFVITSPVDRIPDYVHWNSEGDAGNILPQECLPRVATLYFDAGRRQKISRGDIAGFILKNSGLGKDELGRIDIDDNCAFAAVPAQKARQTVEELKPCKLKGKKVRVSRLEG